MLLPSGKGWSRPGMVLYVGFWARKDRSRCGCECLGLYFCSPVKHHFVFFLYIPSLGVLSSKETKSSSVEKGDSDSTSSKSDQASEKASKARSSSEKEHKKGEPSTGDKRPAKFEDNLVEYTKRHKTCGRTGANRTQKRPKNELLQLPLNYYQANFCISWLRLG